MKNPKIIKLSLIFIALFCVNAFSQIPQTCLSDSLPKATDSNPNLKQGVFRTSSKWISGQKIRVKFLDGDEFVKSKVKLYAQVWEQSANIDFVFVESGTADIRVSFELEKGASWSLVGKSSQVWSIRRKGNSTETYQGTDGVSMNFGWFDSRTSDAEFRRTTLHEFGHAIGLLHEHQNSNANFDWNKPVVLNYYMNELGWSREQVDNAIFKRYGNGTEFSNRAYDKDSIMHYPIDASFTKNGVAIGRNSVLSAGDKLLVAEMYPFDSTKYDSEFAFKNIAVEYNVEQNDRKGMKFLLDFNINKAKGEEHLMAIYFYTPEGKALKDANNSYRAKDGGVSTWRTFKPNFDRTVYTDFAVFLPYTELDLPCGEYRLKYVIYAWQDSTKIANSGYSYFTYRKPCE